MITVYGIRNCDKIKRTLAWFEGAGVAVRFHDYRKDGLDAGALSAWVKTHDWNSLINRSGTTWRAIPDEVKRGVTSAKAATSLMISHPALIKRPVVSSSASGDAVHVGYDEAVFRRLVDGERAA